MKKDPSKIVGVMVSLECPEAEGELGVYLNYLGKLLGAGARALPGQDWEKIPRLRAEPELAREVVPPRSRRSVLDSVREAIDAILRESAEQVKLQTELARLEVERLRRQVQREQEKEERERRAKGWHY